MKAVRQISGSIGLIKTCVISMMLVLSLAVQSQVIGTWNFNGTTSGTAGSFNTVSVADFSPAVPTRSFNAGSEYYGHNGWPTGAIDVNFYIAFTLSPNSGYALNIQSLNLRLRHSNTGSSGGSGPEQFTVRSSLDGYTGDLATGSITGAYSNFIFAPGAAFNNLPIPVTFRIYGHNAVMYSGGNNRLVFDNITVDAIGIVLPLKLLSFQAKAGNDKIILEYHLTDVAVGTQVVVERSTDNRIFNVMASEQETTFQSVKMYVHTDDKIPPGARQIYYRVRIIKPGGDFIYSKVVAVKTYSETVKLTVIYNRNVLKLDGLAPGASKMLLYNSMGKLVFSSVLSAGLPGQTISNLPFLPKGVYYLRIIGLDLTQEASFLS
jgi:hypothetical protein